MDLGKNQDSVQDRKVRRDANLKVFFNSACPVCNAGVSIQRRKMSECDVDWLDIHTDENARDRIGENLEFVRERLHVIDKNGNTAVGLRAFETIWRHSPNEIWKAKIVSLPVVRSILDLTYNGFARILYKWNRWRRHW